MCSFGINPGYRQQTLRSHFSELFPLCQIFSAFWFPEALFFSPPVRKLGFWLPHFALHFCSSAWVIPEDTHKVMRLAPSSWDHNSTNWRERLSTLRPLVPATSSLSLSQDRLEAGMHWNEENGLCTLLGPPFSATGAQTRGLLLLLFLCPGAHFHFQIEQC